MTAAPFDLETDELARIDRQIERWHAFRDQLADDADEDQVDEDDASDPEAP